MSDKVSGPIALRPVIAVHGVEGVIIIVNSVEPRQCNEVKANCTVVCPKATLILPLKQTLGSQEHHVYSKWRHDNDNAELALIVSHPKGEEIVAAVTSSIELWMATFGEQVAPAETFDDAAIEIKPMATAPVCDRNQGREATTTRRKEPLRRQRYRSPQGTRR